ncbi:MAG: 16S rRNA (guanine(966)-N(2))-methyltransferase RsmD [Chlamydiae bacterium RIFCSPHIGHO2_12_FULL_49_11]|nr:MAG: 16S rRNA (guanine(966)-N(2))-methyltransferase RsmD [Chlamydiae bacterium RIFCSPHIGHO2_12_FULL_49_11]
MKTRILAGLFKNRPILLPKGVKTRPITQSLKKSIFDILGERIAGANVLDLFAGSGSIGLEALSRGSRFCLFVDKSREAKNALCQNIELLKVQDRSRFLYQDAFRLIEGPCPFSPFDLLFLDPPYPFGRQGYERLLSILDKNRSWTHEGSLLIVEMPSVLATCIEPPSRFIRDRVKRTGTTHVAFYTVSLT